MADGQVRGVFDLDTRQAIRGVRDYRREAALADKQTRQLGDTIDRTFGQKREQEIRRIRGEVKGLATDTGQTRVRVVNEWKGMRRGIEREGAAIVSVISTVRDRMRALGRERASINIDLDGVTQALAQVELLEARLAALGARSANPRVNLGGGFGGGGGRGGGMRFGRFSARTIAGASAIGIPAIQSLVGGTAALLGSGGAAIGGAGAVGVGGGGVLVTGLLSVVPAAKAANKAIETATKAQDAYTQAVKEYGVGSQQAKQAAKERDAAFANQPGLKRAIREIRQFNRERDRALSPARRNFTGLRGDMARIARRGLPYYAQNAEDATGAVRKAGQSQARFLVGEESRLSFGIMARQFARDLPIAERSLQNIEKTMFRLARAARPLFHDGIVWWERTTRGWAASTRGIGETREGMRGLVEDTKDWGQLISASWGLIQTIGQAGRPSGSSMVVSLTEQFQTWDRWMQRNPAQVRQFFDETTKSVREMANGLKSIVYFFNQMAEALRPVLDRFSQLVSIAGSLGLLAPGAGALLFGGAAALRGGRAAAGAGGGAGAAGAGGAGGAAAGGLLAGMSLMAGGRYARAGLGAYRGARAGGAGVRGALGASRGALGTVAARRGTAGQGRGALRGVGGGALKRFGLIAGIMAALDFASSEGSVTSRAQSAASTLTLGAIGRPQTRARASDNASQAANNFLERSVYGNPATLAGSRQGLTNIDAEIARLSGYRERSQGGKFLHAMNEVGSLGTSWGKDTSGGSYGGVSASKFDEIQKRIELLKSEREEIARNNKEMERQKSYRLDALSEVKAERLRGDLSGAYRAYRKQYGQVGAMSRTAKLATGRILGTRDAGVEAAGEGALGFARDHGASKAEVDRITTAIEARYRRMGRTIRIVNGDIRTGSRAEWAQIRDSLTSASATAAAQVSRDFTTIQRKAVGTLVAMGFSDKDARRLVQGAESKSSNQRQLATTAMNAGPRAPGTIGSNKAGPAVSDAVRGPRGDGWGDGLGNGGRSAAAAAQRNGGPATGLRSGAAAGVGSPTGGLMGANPGLASYVQDAASYGLRVSSGLRPGAITSAGNQSYHSTGNAIDLAGSPQQMMAFAQHAASAYGPQLEELIYSPMGYSIKNGVRTAPYAVADHYDHVHLADTSPGVLGAGAVGGIGGLAGMVAGGGAQQVSVSGVGRKQGGVPGAMRQRAGDIYAAGLEQMLNQQLGGGGPGGDIRASNGMLSFDQVARIAESVGLPGVTFAQIAQGESSLRVGAIGNDPGGTQGLGLWQITTGFNDDIIAQFGGRQTLLSDPYANARAAKAIYDRQGIGAWYGTKFVTGNNLHFQGDGVGWAGAFDKSGEFITNGPTMFMAGEGSNRRESVRVQRAGQSFENGSGKGFTIEHMEFHISAGTGADAKAIGEEVVSEIMSALDRAGAPA
jgi:hypothetical protein